MKIIGLAASPRKGGNTAWVINTILEGAKEQGGETRSLYFSDLDIHPCRSCYACRQGDMRGQIDTQCVINDDMHEIYDAMNQADTIVLGSPVYMGQMSAQAKMFNDRLFGSRQYQPRFHPQYEEKNAAAKKLVLVFTQGNPDSGKFQVYFDYTKNMFQMLGFDVKGVHVVAGMRNELAHERKDMYAAMKDIGSSLVS